MMTFSGGAGSGFFRFVIAIAIGFFSNCYAATDQAGSPHISNAVQLDDGVIFGKQGAAKFLANCDSKCKSKRYWVPQKEDIDQFNVDFVTFLSKFSDATSKSILGNYPDYRKQYFGYVGENGERRIFVNAFCKGYWGFHSDWRVKFVTVLDGGNCYFQLQYNVVRHTFGNINVNGDA